MLQSTYRHECLPLNGDINMIKMKEPRITERLPEPIIAYRLKQLQ